MNTLLAKTLDCGTRVHFANALDQDVRVVADFAGDGIMILPDLVCSAAPSFNEIPKLKSLPLAAPSVFLIERAIFPSGDFR
jgi:hypothetical protein